MARFESPTRSIAGTKRQAMERQAIAARFGRARPPFSLVTHKGPLPMMVVDVVRTRAEERFEREDGCEVLSLSARQLNDPTLRMALGPHVGRAAAIRVVWDPRDCQVIEVIEGYVPQGRSDDEDDLWMQAKHDITLRWSAAA